MSKIRRALTFVAALALYALVMPISAFAATPTTIEVSNSSEFDKAVATVNGANSGEYIIELTDSFESNGVSFNSSCPTTLLGNGHTITLGRYSSISVSKGAELNLGSSNDSNTLTIKGKGKDEPSNDVPGLLYVEGTCNMHSGTTLADREGNNYFGGGITVQGGTFHMLGGTIENCGIDGGSVCYGGGVAVIYGGSFVMDAGEITNCYAKATWKCDWDSRMITAMGGGVFVSGGSSFIMNGGTIENNSATDMGGGVAIVASIEEVSSGFGTLKSSAELRGGAIKGNEAHDGAGVFASGYYYAGAYGLCADTPSIGAQANQGLRIKDANILGNKADQQDGRGGGVFTVMLKAPAAAHISNATIKGNNAAIGGGVMSYGYYTAMNIDGSAITGNTATTYGGGFAADTNTSESAGTTVTNTKLCNNTANKAASDVYLNDAAMKLSSAKDMNELYLGKPEDVTNQKIDGWYVDDETSRYTAQSKGERNEYVNYGSIESGNKVCLIAASNPTLAKVTFTNEDGSVLYGENHYTVGTKADQIAIPTPTKPSDDTYNYIFDSWHTTIKDVTGDAVYKAQFKKVFKKFNVKHTFSCASSGNQLPNEILALLPKDTNDYAYNDEVNATGPSQTTIKVANGTWIFMGYDKDSAIADMTTADTEGNVTFTGTWKFVENSNTPSVPNNSDQSGANGGDKPQTGPNSKSETGQGSDSTSPDTEDSTGVGFCYALLIAAIAAFGSAAYASSKMKRMRNQ